MMLFLLMAKSTILTIILVAFSGPLCAQGFRPPAEGKSVVYMVRGNNFQKNISTLVFDGEKFISDFPGTQYFRYECDPGKHIFWASGEDTDFVVAELKPNGSYVIFIEAIAGSMMPKVRVSPMPGNHKKFHTAKWLITHKSSVVEDAEVVNTENERMRQFIVRCLDAIRTSPEFSSTEKQLLPDMALPIENVH